MVTTTFCHHLPTLNKGDYKGATPHQGRVRCLLGRRTFYAEYSILRSIRHKDLTNRKTGRPFCAPLAHVAPVSCECLWIVTFWLQCHISIFLAIIKFKNILPLVRGPVHWFRIAPVSKCASSLSRFRANYAQKNLRGRRRFYVTSRRIFVVHATSNDILGPDDEESSSSGRHRTRPKVLGHIFIHHTKNILTV